MAEAGRLAVALAWGLAGYAVIASSLGARRAIAPLVQSGRRALLATAGLTTVAMAALVVSLLERDFSVAYVWQTSSTTTPLVYLLTAMWGGQAGSLLCWSWLLALCAMIALVRPWRADTVLQPWFVAVCGTVEAFFLFLVTFVASPFDRLTVMPVEGNGLNPLLQHPGMAVHPPMLYLGFTGLTIPYAYAMAALLARRTDSGWIAASRRWTLVAWSFLGLGLALGARWAYDVLGWGGYWGWDPVENAALMPWLAGTAFLHSVIVQERRGLFKVWNMALVILTFCLVIIGTFLTRAGLVTSVHSFAQSAIGPYFLVFTAAVVLGSILLLWRRLPDLRDEGRIEAVCSRETAFLANNLVFVSALFAVFWGTLFPLISEIVTGQRVTVGPPYFNAVALPVLGVAVVLMAAAPVMAWRRGDCRRVAGTLSGPLLVACAASLTLFALGVRAWIAQVGLAIAVFALVATLREMGRGARARWSRGEAPWTALASLFARRRRRYGGYLVHCGVALVAAGVVGSGVYRSETEARLAVGESLAVAGYTLTYQGLGATVSPHKEAVAARLTVARGGRSVGVLEPRREVFRLHRDQPVTVPAVLHRPLADVYTLLGTVDAVTEEVTLKVYLNPLMAWLWLGMTVLVAGTWVAAWPDSAEARVMNAELRRLLDGVAPEAPVG